MGDAMAEWSIPFDKLAEKANKRLEDVIRQSTLLLFSRVVMRSPVDTGRFRGNWISSYGAPKKTTDNDEDKSGRFTLASIRGDVLAFPVGGIVYLCNSLPYAVVLEYGLFPDPPKKGSRKRGEDSYAVHVAGGYSMQARSGMVRVSALEFEAAVKKIVKEVS